ncbi:MAG: hypothetical protein IJA10_15255 [Lachnospiraceae bacterium]|nr:hypothetical protein [Lachnospiraceae bacterium]
MIIYIFCILLSIKECGGDNTIVLALVFLSLTSFYMVANKDKMKDILIMIYVLSFVMYPSGFVFLPMFLYDWMEEKKIWQLVSCFFVWIYHMGQVHFRIEFLVLIPLTVYLFYKTKDLKLSKEQKILLRDQEVEKQLLLKKKNELLYNQMKNQVHMAILTERNRIAREIHDHVGHMISSCILQVGAITTIVKREEEKALLGQLKTTLDEAMNQIRSSVHNIFDESVDLEAELKKTIKILEKFHIDFLYDVSGEMEKDIKFSILAVVKEATNNIVKYSNGDKVVLQLREHPAFYQLLISDNGTNKSRNVTGIGLNSMSERIEKLKGIFRINNEYGFEIFISIPKKS